MCKWINVDARLPETDDHVLVWYSYFEYGDYTKRHYAYGLAQYLFGNWVACNTIGHNCELLYWMPLPEPPKN